MPRHIKFISRLMIYRMLGHQTGSEASIQPLRKMTKATVLIFPLMRGSLVSGIPCVSPSHLIRVILLNIQAQSGKLIYPALSIRKILTGLLLKSLSRLLLDNQRISNQNSKAIFCSFQKSNSADQAYLLDLVKSKHMIFIWPIILKIKIFFLFVPK